MHNFDQMPAGEQKMYAVTKFDTKEELLSEEGGYLPMIRYPTRHRIIL